jgi:hypothetical protein
VTTSDDRGSVTALCVGLVLTFVLLGGLVLDGALMVRTRIEVADHAENAARAGAQALVVAADGSFRLDLERARQRASAYLAQHGVEGEVSVDDTSVSVTARAVTSLRILQLAGVANRPIVVTRSAVAADR